MKINELTEQILLDFFFKAAKSTYAGGAEPEKSRDNPGYKEFIFFDEDFIYEDVYSATSEKYFHGSTQIFLHERGLRSSIWVMHYWACNESVGDKEQDAFLRSTLLKAYNEKLFRGGRGDEHAYQNFAGRTLHYSNNLSDDISERYGFRRFAGSEDISQSCSIIFQFNYVGGLVIDLKQ